MTRRIDVEHAVAAGTDAIGVVTYPGSPRYVPPGDVHRLIADIPVHRYVLTVDLDPDDAIALLRETGADGIQPYGLNASTTVRMAAAAGYRVLRPYRAIAGLQFDADDGPEVLPLVDTPHETLHGGTGETFAWTMLADIASRYVLAGGLDPVNVASAIATARPWGVDASSGLEASPGVKDPGKVTSFVAAAKNQEASPQ